MTSLSTADLQPPAPATSAKGYVYVLVRQDLSFAQQLVQAGHAAFEAGLRFEADRDSTSLIVLGVPDRDTLEAAAERLAGHGIDHALFYEPSWGMGHSALATRPLSSKAERYKMRAYPLVALQACQEDAHVE